MYRCIPITGKKNDSFVGIKVNKNKVDVFYPESFRMSSDEFKRRQDILALIKSISLAKTKYGEATDIYEAKNVGGNFVVDAYLWILNDYLIYGRYINVDKEYINNAHGRINWKRTMTQLPIVSGGNIVYKQYVAEVKHQQDNLLTEIYKYCVRIASAAIGWLIGVSSEEKEEIPFNKSVYETCLYKELESTFDDEKRKRLSVMMSIVSEISSEENLTSSFSYGVNDYSYVYEKMVDEMFGNIQRIQDYYPNGEWQLDAFDNSFFSSNLRPDTVIETEAVTYILDAKFYRFGTTKAKNDLPNTTSIQKQITYGEYISHMFERKKVVNAFVLPYNKENNMFGINGVLECVGTATAKWKKQEHTYEYVFVLLLDTHFLVTSWYKKNEICRKLLISILKMRSEQILQ